MKDKENALKDYKEMIINSWTYKKMTADEQIKLFEEFDSIRTQEALKGDYNARWNILNAVYSFYLKGLGYDGYDWREENV